MPRSGVSSQHGNGQPSGTVPRIAWQDLLLEIYNLASSCNYARMTKLSDPYHRSAGSWMTGDGGSLWQTSRRLCQLTATIRYVPSQFFPPSHTPKVNHMMMSSSKTNSSTALGRAGKGAGGVLSLASSNALTLKGFYLVRCLEILGSDILFLLHCDRFAGIFIIPQWSLICSHRVRRLKASSAVRLHHFWAESSIRLAR